MYLPHTKSSQLIALINRLLLFATLSLYRRQLLLKVPPLFLFHLTMALLDTILPITDRTVVFTLPI